MADIINHNVCYFIGGTGARVAEAAVHMLSAGYFNRNEDIEFVVIDKDFKCKSYTDAIKQVDEYTAVRKIIKRGENAEGDLFKSNILKYNWSFNNIFNTLVNVTPEADLKSSVVSKKDNVRENDQILLHGLYSQEQQERPTAKGFYGHPSIGALMFKYMTKLEGFSGDEINDIASPVVTALNKDKFVKVFIVGTVFGGTGASVVSNLASYLRSVLNTPKMRDNTVIAGVLILPYFNILKEVKDDNDVVSIKISDDDFLPKSQVALEHYGLKNNLIRQDTQGPGEWDFDRIYSVGCDPRHQTSEVYSEGGQDQKSHFDYVDLLAASSIFDFFSLGNSNGDFRTPDDKSNIMLFKRAENILDWSSMPTGIRDNLLTMLKFCSFVITQAYPYFSLGNKRAHSRRNNEMAKNLYGHNMKGHLAPEGDFSAMDDLIRTVFSYCKSYVEFIYDITFTGNDWSEEEGPKPLPEVQLFDKSYIRSLYLLSNDLAAGKDDNETLKKCIGLSLKKEIIPKTDLDINNTYIQNGLNDYFFKRENCFEELKKPDERVGKWLSQAYVLCK